MKLGNRAFYIVMSISGLLACILLGWLRYRQYHTHAEVLFEQLDIYNNDSLLLSENLQVRKPPGDAERKQEVSYFYFDPNTATAEELISLGLAPRVAHTIVRYRDKGGRFYQPQDFKKIYTLSEKDYQRLLPYIRIASPGQRASTPEAPGYTPKTNHPIDINAADDAVWMLQKGIGPAFAGRIVAYREKLGGFLYKEQLREVYGLPDSTYQALLPHMFISDSTVRKINVNTATEEMLAAHPYIGRRMAAAIIRLRTDLGRYSKMEDLRMVPLINEENYRKIAQYLTAE